MLLSKNPLNPCASHAGKDKLYQVVTVKVLPPSVSPFYLGEVRIKLQYLVCLLWMLLFSLSRLFR